MDLNYREGNAAKKERLAREARESNGKLETKPNQESPGMGVMDKPAGLPENFRMLVITFDVTNGNTQVAGPVDDATLCYGMLGRARDVICEHSKKIHKTTEIQKT